MKVPSQSALMLFPLIMVSITACFASAFLPSSQIIMRPANNSKVGCHRHFLSLLQQQRGETSVISSLQAQQRRRTMRKFTSSTTTQLSAAEENSNNDGDNNIEIEPSRVVANDLGLEIIRGTGSENADEIADETWEDIEQSAPSQLMVVKNLLGVNIFTYILAALIAFFLSMNAIFGVGWLGQSLGWENVGTFTEVSDKLPLDVDVSGTDYLL